MNWSHIDICNFYSLVACNLQLFSDNLWWPLDRQAFLWASLAFNRSAKSRLNICLLLVFFFEEVKFLITLSPSIISSANFMIGLLEGLIDLDWWHELPLSKQGVNLFDKLEGGVLLI